MLRSDEIKNMTFFVRLSFHVQSSNFVRVTNLSVSETKLVLLNKVRSHYNVFVCFFKCSFIMIENQRLERARKVTTCVV